MKRLRSWFLTFLAMAAFAGNSILCRLALKSTAIDPASFTSVRLVSGALVLWLAARASGKDRVGRGSWRSALYLFVYAAGFSLAYVTLSASVGALLLFGAVQVTMVGVGVVKGERLTWRQGSGLLLAFGGLVALVFPGLSAPPLWGSLLMLGAGAAWGLYSLRGRTAGDPTVASAGNFLRAVPMALVLSLLMLGHLGLDPMGLTLAIASGAVTSGLGYAVWYTALKALNASEAAGVQLSVPVLTALVGISFLGEPLSTRIVLSSLVIISGIVLIILRPRQD